MLNASGCEPRTRFAHVAPENDGATTLTTTGLMVSRVKDGAPSFSTDAVSVRQTRWRGFSRIDFVWFVQGECSAPRRIPQCRRPAAGPHHADERAGYVRSVVPPGTSAEGAAYQHATRVWIPDRLFTAADLARVRTVVEVDCGDGCVCGHLARRFPCVVGFDLSATWIDRSHQGRVLLFSASAA